MKDNFQEARDFVILQCNSCMRVFHRSAGDGIVVGENKAKEIDKALSGVNWTGDTTLPGFDFEPGWAQCPTHCDSSVHVWVNPRTRLKEHNISTSDSK